MFGWGDFRKDEKLREENRVKNSVFYCLATEGKHWGKKNWEKIFSPGSTILFLLNWEENCGGEKWTCGIFTQMPLSPTLFTNTTTVPKKIYKKKIEWEMEKDLREWEHFLNEEEKERKEGGDKKR